MREIRVIGVTGRARAGKDTVANMIKDHIGGSRYSFATPIYDMLAAIGFDFRSSTWSDHKDKTIPGLGVSPRRMLQTLGTEWGRELVHPDFWLMLAEIQLDKMSRMVVSDVRFENEATWVRKHGVLIRVVRTDAASVEAHASENGVEPTSADILINNNGTLKELEQRVQFILNHVIEA